MILLTLALVAAAPEPAPAVEPTTPAATEKKICRSKPVPNSRLGRTRECRTRAQWQAIDNGGRGDVEDMMKTPSR